MENKDEDDFTLIFESDTTQNEKEYFRNSFPNVSTVSTRRLHCTACDDHIGTAPIMGPITTMHPILKVTVCKKCYTFYNSGEFEKGEDGSELFCRWCGQGGEVYCCCKCPFVFCKKCIVNNLSRTVLNEIRDNETWECFRCDPSNLKSLQATHWALKNYFAKQNKSLEVNCVSHDEIDRLMNKDNSVCCAKKQYNKSRASSSFPVYKSERKRSRLSHLQGPNDGPKSLKSPAISLEAIDVTSKRPYSPSVLLNSSLSGILATKMASPGINTNDEIICMPDIFGMPDPNPAASSKNTNSSSDTTNCMPILSQRPPLRTESALSNPKQGSNCPSNENLSNNNNNNSISCNNNNLNRINTSTPNKIYHLVNGYRIDVNSAAKYSTLRLPNGKLVQVRKQPNSDNYKFGINKVQQPQEPARLATITQAQQRQQQQQQPTRLFNSINVQQSSHLQISCVQSLQMAQAPQSQQNRPRQQLCQTQVQRQLQQPQPEQPHQIFPNIIRPFGQQQRFMISAPTTMPSLISIAKAAAVPAKTSNQIVDDALIKCRNRVKNATDLSDHIKAKLISLNKSHADAKDKAGIRDLNTHLTDLIGYSIRRFQNLKDSCTEDLIELDKEHAESAEGEVEVVEANTDLIEID